MTTTTRTPKMDFLYGDKELHNKILRDDDAAPIDIYLPSVAEYIVLFDSFATGA